MESLIETPDIFLEMASYINPCEIMQNLRLNHQTSDIIFDKNSLYKLAYDRGLPFNKNTTLTDLCEFYRMKLNGTLSIYAASIGDIRVLKSSMSDDGSYYAEILKAARLNGYYKIINLIIDSAQLNNIDLPYLIAKNGDMISLLMVIPKYNEDIYDSILIGGVSGDNPSIVQFAIDNGATDYNNACQYAALHGNLRMMKWMSDLDELSGMPNINYDDVLYYAVEGNSSAAADMTLKLAGELDYDLNLHDMQNDIVNAIKNSYGNIVSILAYYINDQNVYVDLAKTAIEYGKYNILRYMLRHIDDVDWESLIDYAVKVKSSDEIIELLEDRFEGRL